MQSLVWYEVKGILHHRVGYKDLCPERPPQIRLGEK